MTHTLLIVAAVALIAGGVVGVVGAILAIRAGIRDAVGRGLRW